jgi:hypothetical protein
MLSDDEIYTFRNTKSIQIDVSYSILFTFKVYFQNIAVLVAKSA